MANPIAPRRRKVRVLATLGLASASPEMIRKLYLAGADAFRVNMSHGDHAGHEKVIAAIRAAGEGAGAADHHPRRPPGPKLRVGTFAEKAAMLETGSTFVLDRDATPGDETRVLLPHPEIFRALTPGARLLLDDGKLVLRVQEAEA